MAHIYILITALAVAGWAAAYIGSRGAMKRTCEQMRADLRLEFQRQIDALSENVKNFDRTSRNSASATTPVVTNRVPSDNAHPPETGMAAEEITPEILRTLTETITALLGRKIRIRSVKILQTPDTSANSWAQHGRAVIQASHNLVQRGRDR
jgi:hypothetical protein